MKPRIAFTIGDFNGIAPEVISKISTTQPSLKRFNRFSSDPLKSLIITQKN